MIGKYSYQGDINIGFYATLTDEYVIVPHSFKDKEFFPENKVVIRMAGTRLVGLFTEGNSNGLLLPESVKEREVKKLEEKGIEAARIDSAENALGNLVLVNNKGALISPKLKDVKDRIAEVLDVPVTVGEIAGIPNSGVCAVANDRGAVIHREATEEDAELVAEALDIENVDIGTINMGSPYMGSGAVANTEGVLVGGETTGPEIGRLDRVMESHEE
ncbi:MAG: translation initiation factor IF-6 [Candidatus Nanohaloarchaea archaeon]